MLCWGDVCGLRVTLIVVVVLILIRCRCSNVLRLRVTFRLYVVLRFCGRLWLVAVWIALLLLMICLMVAFVIVVLRLLLSEGCACPSVASTKRRCKLPTGKTPAECVVGCLRRWWK